MEEGNHKPSGVTVDGDTKICEVLDTLSKEHDLDIYPYLPKGDVTRDAIEERLGLVNEVRVSGLTMVELEFVFLSSMLLGMWELHDDLHCGTIN